jgi:hypothetical protein
LGISTLLEELQDLQFVVRQLLATSMPIEKLQLE